MCIFVHGNPSIICSILNLTIYVNQSEQFNCPEKLPPDEKSGDNDHKPLKDIYNRLDRLTGSAIERQELARILSEMYDYSRAQFLREELSMKKVNYTEFASHKKLHMVFIYTVAMYNVNFSNGKPPEIHEILSFITQWWNNHILIADKDFEHFITTSAQPEKRHSLRY